MKCVWVCCDVSATHANVLGLWVTPSIARLLSTLNTWGLELDAFHEIGHFAYMLGIDTKSQMMLRKNMFKCVYITLLNVSF